MNNVLIVDDSKFILAYVEDALKFLKNISISKARSYGEAEALLRHKKFQVAIVDLNLPDAQNGEAVDLVKRFGVPAIVLTATMSESTRKIILKKDVVEYVPKKNPKNVTYVATVVKRILANYNVYVLIVDSVAENRKKIKTELEQMHLNVLESPSAEEAIKIIEEHKYPVSLVITAYDMPRMNGMELIIALREQYSKDQLSIIALSGLEAKNLSTEFLKHGANDFIKKPFVAEELRARVNINLDVIDMFRELQDRANKDFLTGFYNRRYFFEEGKQQCETSMRRQSPMVVAMIDIDHFKKINDTYGHDAGDLVLKSLSDAVEPILPKDALLSRFGGEEFCLLMKYDSVESVDAFFERLRKTIADYNVIYGAESFSYTVSIGVCIGECYTLEDLIKKADHKLYEAKRSGRNMVLIERQ